jgi:hypothetical protein
MYQQQRDQSFDSPQTRHPGGDAITPVTQLTCTEKIECRGFIVRVGRQGGTPIALEIDVTHPKFPEIARTFELSRYLQQGLAASPATVQQIISKDSLESTRLDALRVLTEHIASSELRRQGVPAKDGGSVSVSEHPPRNEQGFRLENSLGTNWRDVLNGHSRQVLSVFRGGSPLVEFSVCYNEAGDVAGALINLLPLELRWPILNPDGSAVDRASVWKAIEDYVTFLDKTKHYPWPQALEDLGAVQDLRRGKRGDRVDEEVSCVMQVALSVLDEHRYATDPSFSIVNPTRAPFGLEGFARALPDERVLWTSGPDVAEDLRGLEFTLGGFSTYGAPYKVSAIVPQSGEGVLWDAVRQIRFSRSWTDLERGLVTLARSPGIQFSVTEITDREVFPRGVNELVERLRRREVGGIVDLGLGAPLAGEDIATNAWLVGGLIRGMAPIHARFEGPSLSSSWQCEGFLDEDLHGQLFFWNQLGGELIVTPHGLGGSWRKRMESLEGLIVSMCERPTTFARDVLGFEGVDVRSDNLPSRSGDELYASVDRIALLWRRSFKDSQAIASRFSRMSPYRTHELGDGRWALAQQSSLNGKRSYHTMVVGPEGVEAIFISSGERGWLGKLRGTEVRPTAKQKAFKDWELKAVLPLLVPSDSSVPQKSIHRVIASSIGGVSIRRAVSMREFDPERNQRDMVSIASQWLRGLFR